MAMKMKIDALIAVRDMEFNINNANASVGRVTVCHMAFNCIVYWCRNGQEKEALKVMRIAFGAGAFEGKKAKYHSPIKPEERTQDGFSRIDVGYRMVAEAMKAIMMAAPTVENMIAAAADFVVFGRMFQEGTIDASKKGGKIVIAYFDGVAKIAYLSRKAKVHVLPAWCRKERARSEKFVKNNKAWKFEDGVAYTYGDGDFNGKSDLHFFVGNNGKTRLMVRDPLFKVGKKLIEDVVGYTKWAMSFKPRMSQTFFKAVEEKRRDDEGFRALVHLFLSKKKNNYRTLASAQTYELNRLPAMGFSKEENRDRAKEIKARYRTQFEALGNEMRREARLLAEKLNRDSFSAIDMIQAAIWLSYHDDNGKARADEFETDNFAGVVMPQEFTWFMYECMRKAAKLEGNQVEIPEFTEDRLDTCDEKLADGNLHHFEEGFCEEEDAYAEAEKNLTGDFLIRKTDHGYVASKNIEAELYAAIPTKPDMTTIQVVTAATASASKELINIINDAVSNGKEIGFVHECFYGQKEKGHIVIDGVAVSLYRHDMIKKPDWKFYPTFLSDINRAFDSMFDGYVGKVSNAAITKTKGGIVTAVLTFSNVRKQQVIVKKVATSMTSVAAPKAPVKGFHCSFFRK